MSLSNRQEPCGTPPGGSFFTTRWTMVLSAGSPASCRQSDEALGELCQSYWMPLYMYLRRIGQSPDDAQDLVQAFFAHLLADCRLAQVDPAKGRFRSFLLASLRHFLTDEQRKRRARKRGGDVHFVALDVATAEERFARHPAERAEDPAMAFERRWALTVLDRVLARLEGEYAAAGKAERFEKLSPLLMDDDSRSTYGEVGAQLGLSEGAVKMAVMRLRQRGRELLREEVAQTVATEEEIDDEVRHIFAILAG